jgi:hypothetical protein
MSPIEAYTLNCPAGCGQVEPTVRKRAVYVTEGRRGLAPILVCPHCGTRLLPTRLEIERTLNVEALVKVVANLIGRIGELERQVEYLMDKDRETLT